MLESQLTINTNQLNHEVMRRYIIRVYTKDDPEDGFSVWVDAKSKEEAFDYVRGEYWGITELFLVSVEDCD